MCWWSACLYDGISRYMFYFIGIYFLLDDMFYLRVCNIGGHVFQFMLRIGFTGRYVLEVIYYMRACLAGVHGQLEYM